MKLSVAFKPALDTPGNVSLAEDLGYHRAWLYDPPPQSPDVWMTLARVAERTERIGLGPGVLVPMLRHPIVVASSARALECLAPGRVALAFGTGLAPRVLGQERAVAWSYVTHYVDAVRRLLRGEVVEWDGGKMKLFDADESPPFPLDPPVYIGAIGPKGLRLARGLTDHLFVAGTVPAEARGFREVAYLVSGTVMEGHENVTDERVRDAGGPGLMAMYHGGYGFYGDEFVASLPGGEQWLEVVNAAPEDERHFTAYRGHFMVMNDADKAAWMGGAHAALRDMTITGTPDEVRSKVETYAAQGVTELVFQPAQEVERELRMMADVVGDLVSA